MYGTSPMQTKFDELRERGDESIGPFNASFSLLSTLMSLNLISLMVGCYAQQILTRRDVHSYYRKAAYV